MRERKRDLERDQRAHEARFRAFVEAVVEDFLLDAGRADVGDGRPFEVVTKNFVIRGRVSPIAASTGVGAKGPTDRKDPQRRNTEAIGRGVGGMTLVIKYLLNIIRDYSETMVRELDEPYRADAREIFEASAAAAALIRMVLEEASPPAS